jgi:hypothetical protein
LNPGASLWSLEWIAGVMLQDVISNGAGWRVHTPVKALPFEHLSYGFRADNHSCGNPVLLFAQADEEGFGEFQGQTSYNVIAQVNFQTAGAWPPSVQTTLIPKALASMQTTFAAASSAPQSAFWQPLK